MKSHMATTGIAAALALLATAALGKDNGEKSYDLVDFESLEISGVFDVTIAVGDDFSILLSGDEAELDRAGVSVTDGVLKLASEKSKYGLRNKSGLEAVISMPSLRALDISGVSEVEVAGIDINEFRLELSGVGDVTLAGACGLFDARVSGVGDLDAKALECASVDIEVSGIGGAVVFARDAVDARVSGMGDIDIYGSPAAVAKSASMFAEVTVH